MKRIAFFLFLALVASHGAAAETWWSQISIQTTPSNAPKVVEAVDKLMSSEVGKTFPGRLLLQSNVADGANPATHSFVPIYKTAADREEFVKSLNDSAAWTEFQRSLEKISRPRGQVLYRNLASWGDINDTDGVWMAHAFTVSDPASYLAALNALMASPTGKKFPGQVYLSAVVAGGMSPVTHVVSVGYASVEEMASWLTIRDASADWATYQAASRKVSQYLGGSLANTAKTWGSAGMKDVVAR